MPPFLAALARANNLHTCSQLWKTFSAHLLKEVETHAGNGTHSLDHTIFMEAFCHSLKLSNALHSSLFTLYPKGTNLGRLFIHFILQVTYRLRFRPLAL
ncbi:hypothetical protein DUNSADRAFT_4579 [Dunaliella salina]|uniref:Encoded protein n=1 Tax=Dunaliella salina TaxID=3046 RepID=A0ABQ7FUR2_DUNSA|nr:hypothetical protein DUNSADRAFT_4579 [Dunaliella salina]|eukprot:KAF5826143.1 hypothetical protein DUNSADRAFT_4579 [Dunaliella salina]